MTLFALLLALAQQGGQPTTHDQPGVTQPSPNDVSRDKSATSNTTDKAESLPTEHNTDLQGGTHAKHAKKSKAKKTQARSKKPLPEASPAPSTEKQTNDVERGEGQGKARRSPKPLGEKSNQ
jgi:hypothetical protein